MWKGRCRDMGTLIGAFFQLFVLNVPKRKYAMIPEILCCKIILSHSMPYTERIPKLLEKHSNQPYICCILTITPIPSLTILVGDCGTVLVAAGGCVGDCVSPGPGYE
jgi:hypothetical protein